jgi:light-regulated signal transduction histidine kinase (bacteriophytochrome)
VHARLTDSRGRAVSLYPFQLFQLSIQPLHHTALGRSRAFPASFRIFTPFVQLGKAATHNGIGLGLSITRQFVQMMGGTISVLSIPGEGSVYRVDLPVEQAEETAVVPVN